MKTPELKPCPFTGDIPSIKTSLSASQFIDGNYLEVHQCVFILPEYEIVTSIQTDGEVSVEDLAIRFWNTRVYPPEVQAAINRDKPIKAIKEKQGGGWVWLCGNCKGYLTSETPESFCIECGQRLDWGV